MAAEMITGALVSTFVERTIDNLASRFGDIFRGKKANKKQLSILKVKLLAVDVVADDAEQKQFTDPRVRDWLLTAKGVVFDAEDLLDEIDSILSKSQVEAQSHSTAKKVLNSLKSSFVSFFKENEIETRIEKVIEDLEDLATRSHVLGLKKADAVEVRSGSKLSSTYLPNESEIYGREDDKQFVCNWLTSDTQKNLSILSIVGMGGVGKTTLAQHVFNDSRTDEAKFDVKAWVCVSDEFDVFKVSKVILEHVTTSTDDSRDTEMVHKKLKEKLTGKKFLLILDDVWNENQSKWDEVQKPLVFGDQGSRILVTTRSKQVASTMRSEEHSLEQLEEDHCWKLFAKHAFRDDDTQPNQECREIGMKIVKKCKGLPLALKTMGSLLYNKSCVSEWQIVFQSKIWEFSKERCDIIPALALSYIHLPSHLKVCFAYCALFPKDYEFEKEDLIKLWMTENFPHRPQHNRTPKEFCQQYFNDLLSRSFFQQLDEKREVFVMHDLIHDLAKYVGGSLYFMCEPDQTENVQKVTRHFSVELGYASCFDGFGTLCNTERLRTFIPNDRRRLHHLSRSWDIKMSIPELLSKFKFLRILSLSYCSHLKELPDSIGNLEHVRSIDLSDTAIKRITEKICLLSHLQILKLNSCTHLEELPSNLHLLTNLLRLEFKYTRVRKLPPHLGKLKNLRVVMDSFDVGHGRELGIQQLGGLNLEGSLSIGNLKNISNSVDALEADLKNKSHLEELTLNWGWSRNSIDSKQEEDVIENLQPCKTLKELTIRNYGGKRFPNWLLDNSLWNMVHLVLVGCESCERLPPLGLLPFLKVLEITNLNGIVSIDGDFHGNNSCSFKSLETLEFSYMSRWEKWDCQAVTGAFPRLRRLSIAYCYELKGELPEQVVSLERLEIEYCQELEASAPRALHLNLHKCGKLQLEWATMKRLTMKESPLLEIVRSDTLEYLQIDSPLKSFNDDCVSLLTFQMDLFPTLRTLRIRWFGNLQMISQSLIHNHLEELTLKNCRKLESLLGSMHMLLPSLRKLWIEDCPRIESFPEGGFPPNLETLTIQGCSVLESFPNEGFPPNLQTLTIQGCLVLESFPDEGFPSNLQTLKIKGCPRLKSFPLRGFPSNLQSLAIEGCSVLEFFPDEGFTSNLKNLTIDNCFRPLGSLEVVFTHSYSLETLWISEVDAECFPVEGLLPLSLTSLTIFNFPNLEKLDYKGLHKLPSLKKLNLMYCRNLQRLPEEGLPKSISYLRILGCPLLEPRCQEGGEDWEKIAHIQERNISQ